MRPRAEKQNPAGLGSCFWEKLPLRVWGSLSDLLLGQQEGKGSEQSGAAVRMSSVEGRGGVASVEGTGKGAGRGGGRRGKGGAAAVGGRGGRGDDGRG
jgi:hypothetical protein